MVAENWDKPISSDEPDRNYSIYSLKQKTHSDDQFCFIRYMYVVYKIMVLKLCLFIYYVVILQQN